MKLKTSVIAIAIILICYSMVQAWGFWGHQHINNKAVFTLPKSMFGFFKTNIGFITEHAVDPDKRRYADPEEAPRHFIDIDRYGEHPFDSLPRTWKEAVVKIGEDTLKAHGIVPYHIPKMLYRLTEAFKDKDKFKILKYAAELGHYVGDAHVPLHCTRNYNGQLTGQHGIHGFWESRIPETYGEDYDYFVGRARYIKDPITYTWNIIKESYAAHDSVLQIEKELNARTAADRKYAFEERGATIVKVYSKDYTAEYNELLNGMVERRMRQATIAVGSFWYTAWVNAGMPEINDPEVIAITVTFQTEMDSINNIYTNRKRSGSGAGHED
jgi:hypothetical protein